MSGAKSKFSSSKWTIDTDSALSLQSLYVSLSHHELREFRRWIDQVDFRYDLLSNLPLEVTQQILGYLPLHECFRMRRVSKEWSRRLSAPQTLEHLLRSWYSGAEAKVEIPNGLTASAVLASRAEQVDAYRSGKAFSMNNATWSFPNLDSTTRKIAYANGYIAWIESSNNIDRFHLK